MTNKAKRKIYGGLRLHNDFNAIIKGRILQRLFNKFAGRMFGKVKK